MTALATVERTDDELNTLGRNLVASGCFPDTSTAAQAVVKMLAGAELGLGPIDAMRSFHVLTDGKIAPSAALLARAVKAHPRYHYTVAEFTDEACELVFWEDGDESGTSRYTLDDARRAGLIRDKSAWVKQPRNMLFNRAITNGVAWFAPDVLTPVGSGASAWSVSVSREPEAVVDAAPDPDPSGDVGHSTDAPVEAEPDEAPAYGEGASGSEGEAEPDAPAGGDSDPTPAAAPAHDGPHDWQPSTTMPGHDYCGFPDCLATRRG
jgi:hypothetical protein